MPGGFCKSDEDVIEAAKRELYEETNVKMRICSLLECSEKRTETQGDGLFQILLWH